MTNYQKYKEQVELLLLLLPVIGRHECFALHGGSAINLFVRNMPRLSVDIDLTYLPVESRSNSLLKINQALEVIGQGINKLIPTTIIRHKYNSTKLLVSDKKALVKIEVNQIKRGCYSEPVLLPLCDNAQRIFNSFSEIKVVEMGHLYGGKVCAALDRQHPRDLFDIYYMLKTEGFTEVIKKGFLFYLVSSNRPTSEIIFPHLKDQRSVFENQFAGMTEEAFTYADYEQTQEDLIDIIHDSLNKDDKRFLIQLENGTPDWDIYPFHEFPAIQWKLMNIEKLKTIDPVKHKESVDILSAKLEVL